MAIGPGGALLVHPLVHGVQGVGDRTDPLGVDVAVARARVGREVAPRSSPVGDGREGIAQPCDRRETAVHPLPVHGDEELLGDRELAEIRGQDHRSDLLLRPGIVNGLEHHLRALDRGVGPGRRARLGVVGPRGDGSCGIGDVGGREAAVRARCQEDSREPDGHAERQATSGRRHAISLDARPRRDLSFTTW